MCIDVMRNKHNIHKHLGIIHAHISCLCLNSDMLHCITCPHKDMPCPNFTNFSYYTLTFFIIDITLRIVANAFNSLFCQNQIVAFYKAHTFVNIVNCIIVNSFETYLCHMYCTQCLNYQVNPCLNRF